MKHKRKRKHLEPSLLPEKRSREELDLQEDDPQGSGNILTPPQDQGKTYSSASFSSEDKLFGAEWQKPPEDAQVTHQNVQASEPQAGETFRLSRYYTAVCAAGLPTPAGHEGLGSSEMALDQYLKERKMVSFENSPSPSSSGSNTSLLSSESSENENVMKMVSFENSPSPSSSGSNPLSLSSESSENKNVLNIYYFHVPVKRGLAVSGDVEELEPPPKRLKSARIIFPEKLLPKHSLPCVWDTASDSEDTLDGVDHEEREEAGGLSGLLAQEAGSSTQTPAGPVGLKGAFQCAACYWVFPTVEALMEHMALGVEEGFACINFHLLLAKLKEERKMGQNITDRQCNQVNPTHGGYMERLIRVLLFISLCLNILFGSLLYYATH